jgi:hypothetical protein
MSAMLHYSSAYVVAGKHSFLHSVGEVVRTFLNFPFLGLLDRFQVCMLKLRRICGEVD